MRIFNHGRKILFLQNHTADVIKIDFCILPFDNRLTADEIDVMGFRRRFGYFSISSGILYLKENIHSTLFRF